MANYVVRVELHAAPTIEQYETLHARMLQRGYHRRILSSDGTWYQLPTAMYYAIGKSEEISAVCVEVRSIASQIATPEPYVFVSNTTQTSWYMSRAKDQSPEK